MLKGLTEWEKNKTGREMSDELECGRYNKCNCRRSGGILDRLGAERTKYLLINCTLTNRVTKE